MNKKEKKQNKNDNYMKENIDLFSYYFINSIVMSLEDIYDADCHLIKSTDTVKEEKTSLIKIINNNLEIKNIINNIEKYKEDEIKVVSIIGSTRMGKSALLNIILSKYGYNNIFPTSKSCDRCTIGIDYFYVPSLKIIFCDVQGLNHEYSSNDPNLLLITYLMSDIIIFSESKMLNKNTLSTLSPLAFYKMLDVQEIDENNDYPVLIFRISDFTLNCNPQDNLEELLFENNDQYKNIIINIKKRFKDIKAFKTEQLDRNELKMLDANNFSGILESDENGFNDFITKLNEELDKIPSKNNFNSWYLNLKKKIYSINLPELIKEEEELIKSINKKLHNNIRKNQYSIKFLRKLDKLVNKDIIDFEYNDDNYILQVCNYYENINDENYDKIEEYYLKLIEKGNSLAMCGLGDYYEQFEEYDKMKKYYLMAIEKGNGNAMCRLGNYYKEIKDYTNMKKYYLMNIEKGNLNGMYYLSIYYEEIKDYENMEKYYLMAIEKGNSAAICNFGHYYYRKKDYENMKKYYLMDIEKGNFKGLRYLIKFYEEIKDYENMKKYYLMAIEKGDSNAMYDLGHYYSYIEKDYDNAKKYFLMALEKGHHRADMSLHTINKILDKNKNFGIVKNIKIKNID